MRSRLQAGVEGVGHFYITALSFCTAAHSYKPQRNQALQRSFRLMGMSIVISILITFLVIVLVLYLINMLPLDARMRQIARVIVIIIGIISLLKYLAVF